MHTYAPVNYTIIGWDNGLPPVRYQKLIWANAGVLLTESLRTIFSETATKIIFIQENAFEKLFCKMAVLSRP